VQERGGAASVGGAESGSERGGIWRAQEVVRGPGGDGPMESHYKLLSGRD